MKILWLMRHAGFARNYEPAIRLLAQRGHQIRIVYDSDRDKFGETAVADRLAAECPEVTVARESQKDRSMWAVAATACRTLQDYARYQAPVYKNAPLLRDRAKKFLPHSYVSAVDRVTAAPGGLSLLNRTLAVTEKCIPASPIALEFLRREQPDLVIVTPLVDFGYRQVEYLKAAARLGIPTALGVASWDNLTNKGLIRWVPDRVFVWNAAQADEAVTLHGVPRDRVVVTGAQIFDQWFTWKPSRTREAFCTDVGLDPSKPFILYLGSSPFLAPREGYFVERWIRALRMSGPALSEVGVLVRPHPNNGREWVSRDLSQFNNARIWPPPGSDPFAPQFKNDFFDSLFHCGVVVGINTSAQIEAAIVGKAVCTVKSADFSHSQEGTLHFRHLAGEESGGLLYVAADFPQHFAQLRDVLEGRADVADRTARFVSTFVRPHGRDVPAAPLLVDAIENVGRLKVLPQSEPAWAPLLRFVMLPWFALTRLSWESRGRPVWAVLLRLIISGSVNLAAFVYRFAEATQSLRSDATKVATRGGRRIRRFAWVVWYESSQRVSKWRAKATKRSRQWRRRIDEGMRRRAPRAREFAGRVVRGAKAR